MKTAMKTFSALCILILVSCKGASSDSGGSGTDSTTVTIKSDQTVGSWPHKIDYYIPSNATAAVVFLHGGGGKKEGFAYNLGLKSDNTTSSYTLSSTGKTWLTNQKIIAVFPQGQTYAGNNWTWDNYVMRSGYSDVSFLQDLVAAIKSDSSLPSISKVYIVGHSNGGMMANRMWCESPTTFDGYVSLAGPPAPGLSSCSPSTVKPYMSLVGDTDKVLQTSGNMAASQWTIKPILVASEPTAWVDSTPKVLNEKLFYSTRTNLKCSSSPATATTSGQVTTYSDCSGTLKLLIISGGDHCLGSASYPCDTTLTGATGLDPKETALSFLKNF